MTDILIRPSHACPAISSETAPRLSSRWRSRLIVLYLDGPRSAKRRESTESVTRHRTVGLFTVGSDKELRLHMACATTAVRKHPFEACEPTLPAPSSLRHSFRTYICNKRFL
jgi:hypothetical protein